MKKRLILGLLISLGACLGVTAEETPFFEVRVDGLSPDVDANAFPAEFKRTNVVVQEKTHLPKVEVRDSAFSKAGLSRDVASLDDLDRDLLWHHAQKLSESELIKKYPKIEASKLKNLKKELSHD